jgi:hypothetical protein
MSRDFTEAVFLAAGAVGEGGAVEAVYHPVQLPIA